MVKNKKKIRERMGNFGFMLAIMFYPLFLFVLFFFSINVKSILFSFQNIDIFGNVTYVGLSNYKEFIISLFAGKDSGLVVYSLYNSVRWWFLNLIISTPINLAFSYYVFCNFKFSKAFRVIAMTPIIMSGMIFSLLVQKTLNFSIIPMLSEVGVELNNFFTDPKLAFPVNVIYSLWSGLTTTLIIIPNAMKNAGVEVIEAAKLDGTGIYSLFWYIVFPLMMPVQVTTWIMGIAGLFGTSYNLVTFYKYDAPEKLYTLGYYFTVKVMTGSNQVEYPMMAAAGMSLTVLATTVTMLAKHFLLKLQSKFE